MSSMTPSAEGDATNDIDRLAELSGRFAACVDALENRRERGVSTINVEIALTEHVQTLCEIGASLRRASSASSVAAPPREDGWCGECGHAVGLVPAMHDDQSGMECSGSLDIDAYHFAAAAPGTVHTPERET